MNNYTLRPDTFTLNFNFTLSQVLVSPDGNGGTREGWKEEGSAWGTGTSGTSGGRREGVEPRSRFTTYVKIREDRRRGENLTLKRRSGKRDSREKVKDIEKSEGLLY